MTAKVFHSAGRRSSLLKMAVVAACAACLWSIGPASAKAAGKGWGQDAPVVGSWTWQGFDGACSESFTFRIDGSLQLRSAQAESVWHYELATAPDVNGFYRLVETLATANGMPDCTGDALDTPEPQPSTGAAVPSTLRFVQLSPARDQLIMCRDASLKACFGPLQRQR